MPGSMPPTNQLDWLSSTTAMIVLFWSRVTRDLLRSFGWGIAALHRLNAATKLPFLRRPPHSVSWSPVHRRRFETILVAWLAFAFLLETNSFTGRDRRFESAFLHQRVLCVAP